MLKETLAHFYELADQARARLGDSAPKITNDIIERAFPGTVTAAELEGCDRMLRDGVKNAVAKYIRKPPAEDRQRNFNDIADEFMPLVEKLGSVAYFVPDETGAGEYVGVPDLCYDRDALDAARRFMRLKGEETLAEADRLDDLFEAIFEASAE